MKKIWIVGLLTLALLLAGAAFADQEDAPVLLVQLPEDDEALRVALVLVSADHCALVYQAVYPQRLGTDQIDDAVQHMVDSMDVLGGASAQDVG